MPATAGFLIVWRRGLSDHSKSRIWHRNPSLAKHAENSVLLGPIIMQQVMPTGRVLSDAPLLLNGLDGLLLDFNIPS